MTLSFSSACFQPLVAEKCKTKTKQQHQQMLLVSFWPYCVQLLYFLNYSFLKFVGYIVLVSQKHKEFKGPTTSGHDTCTQSDRQPLCTAISI